MDRIAGIRKAEAQSHTEVYTTEVLYEGSSWLKKPVRTVLELLPFFKGREEFRVLDLGCGVGRNSIPIAQKFHAVNCRIDCVDILSIAIEKLQEYGKKYEVWDCLNGIVMPLEDYEVPACGYDLILAVSALEHVRSEVAFWDMLEKIREGTRDGGIVCLVINTNISETDQVSGLAREAQFEVNLPTETLKSGLAEVFAGWKVLKCTVATQEYDIPRDRMSHLVADVVTWVAQNNK